MAPMPDGERKSLRTYLTRLVLLSTVPLLLMLLLLAYFTVVTVQETEQNRARHLVSNIGSIIDNDLKTRIRSLEAMALSPMATDPARLADFYIEAVGYRDSFGGQVILADLDSRMLFNTRVPLGTELPLLPVPKGHAAAPTVLATGKPSVGDSFIGPIADELLVAAVVPVLRDGEVRALLLSIVSARFIQEMIDTISLPDGWSVRIIDSKGDEMARRGAEDAVADDQLQEDRFEFASRMSFWRVQLEIESTRINQPVVRAVITLTVGIATVLLISWLGGWHFSRGLARSVASLSEEETGQTGPAIGEVENVRARLSEVAGERQRAVDLRMRSEARLRASIQSIPDEAIIIGPTGECEFANQVYIDRYCRDRSVECTVKSLRCRGPDELGQFYVITQADGSPMPDESTALMRALNGQVVTGFEERLTSIENGDVSWREASCAPFLDADGRVAGAIAIYRDVTTRKRQEAEIRSLNEELEARVAKRTEQLKSVNKELEAFTYTVSHDLKAPLRGIEGYSRLLAEEYRDRLDDEGQLFIDNIRHGVEQMQALINDLLVYSRLERGTFSLSQQDLRALVHGAVSERSGEIEEKGIVIDSNVPRLMVNGDFDGLMILLRNLLDNAIKFSARRTPPRIEIGAEPRGVMVRFWIRDNGIGFDMRFAEQVFHTFQRLEVAEEYPGTGIGLSLVEKVAQQHGGRVWVETEPDQGATFLVELPAWQD